MLYEQYRKSEEQNESALLEFNEEYPEVTNEQNVEDILYAIKLA